MWRDAFLWPSAQGVASVRWGRRVSESESEGSTQQESASREYFCLLPSALCLSNRFRNEPVPHPRLGHDVTGAGGVGLELAAERAHVDADGVGGRAGGGAPDAGDDVLDEERPAGIDRQQLEQ